jgi:hypothetical protein
MQHIFRIFSWQYLLTGILLWRCWYVFLYSSVASPCLYPNIVIRTLSFTSNPVLPFEYEIKIYKCMKQNFTIFLSKLNENFTVRIFQGSYEEIQVKSRSAMLGRYRYFSRDMTALSDHDYSIAVPCRQLLRHLWSAGLNKRIMKALPYYLFLRFYFPPRRWCGRGMQCFWRSTR